MTATIETPVTQDLSYRGRIEALRQTKSAHTAEKIRRRGFMDIDDHGWIPWPDPIPFERQSNHPGGGSYGAGCIGENFRAWLAVHPVYIHPQSALAGAWVQMGPPGVGGWRPEDQPAHLAPLHQQYNIRFTGIGAMNHCGPDLRLGLDLGWGGLLDKIRHYRNLNRPQDPSFYDGEEALVLGMQDWIRRHVAKAREMATAEENPALRDNLLEIAAMNNWLVDHPPRTLREACQFLAWFQSIDRMWFAGGALGQLDELLRPYYEADWAAGRGDDEQTIWCIASLFFNDTHYSQIGGPSPEGRDQTSPVSFLVLEAMHRLKIPINIALRVHDGLDPELLRRAVQYLFEDGTGCSYACAKGLDEGYARNGVPLQVRAGDPISHSANPDPGFTAAGGSAPTAKSNAVAAVQPRWGNTTPLQLDIDAHLSQELGGIEAIEALIKGHNELGGTLININVLSKEQILEAHADPSKYPDLVVRVTGYSAYFRSLSPEYRQQVVDRLLVET